MSNDTALANQVNTLLSGHRVYEKVDDEQSIAKVLRNGKIASDVKIESQIYDMDIFYNESKEKFELMSNQEGASQHYKTLHYYLNLQESEEITPPEEPEVEENTITFYVNEDYYCKFSEFLNDQSKAQKSMAQIMDGDLYIYLGINWNHEFLKNIPRIDLSEIITASDSLGNSLSLQYSCEIIDLVEAKLHTKADDFKLIDSMLEVYTPGVYSIEAVYEDKMFAMNLRVENAYLQNKATIDVFNISCEYVKANGSVIISNILEGMEVGDYSISEQVQEYVKPNEKIEYLDRIAIIIESDCETIITQMNQTKFEYTIPVDSLDLSSDDTISVKFRYQSITGIYCYSEEIIIKVE